MATTTSLSAYLSFRLQPFDKYDLAHPCFYFRVRSDDNELLVFLFPSLTNAKLEIVGRAINHLMPMSQHNYHSTSTQKCHLLCHNEMLMRPLVPLKVHMSWPLKGRDYILLNLTAPTALTQAYNIRKLL